MKRKVIQQGNGTLTITLPKQWTQDVQLTKDSEIEIKINENNLILTSPQGNQDKSIDINVDNFERLSFAKFLIACYEQGFDNMNLVFSKKTINSWSHNDEGITDVINFFVGRLIGFEILSQTKNSIKIGNLAEKHVKFESTLSRIFFLIEEYISNYIESKDLKDLKDGESRHDNITKMIALCQREIFESETFSKTEALNYSIILNSLDKAIDFLRYAYKNTKKSENEIAKDSLKFFDLYRSFFNKFSYDKINQLDQLRGKIKKQNKNIVTSQFDAFVETVHGIIKSRIALEIGSK